MPPTASLPRYPHKGHLALHKYTMCAFDMRLHCDFVVATGCIVYVRTPFHSFSIPHPITSRRRETGLPLHSNCPKKVPGGSRQNNLNPVRRPLSIDVEICQNVVLNLLVIEVEWAWSQAVTLS